MPTVLASSRNKGKTCLSGLGWFCTRVRTCQILGLWPLFQEGILFWGSLEGRRMPFTVIKRRNIVPPGVPWWFSSCHCCGLGSCCGSGSSPGPETYACHGHGQKTKNPNGATHHNSHVSPQASSPKYKKRIVRHPSKEQVHPELSSCPSRAFWALGNGAAPTTQALWKKVAQENRVPGIPPSQPGAGAGVPASKCPGEKL